jgi:hypothetical protein
MEKMNHMQSLNSCMAQGGVGRIRQSARGLRGEEEEKFELYKG